MQSNTLAMWDASLKHLNQALTRAREEHFRDLEGDILILIGKSWRLQGHYERSDKCYQAALVIQRELGNRSQEQNVLLYLGINRAEQRDLQAGRAYLQAALDLAEVAGDLANEARIVNALGWVDASLGLYEKALAQHEQSRPSSVTKLAIRTRKVMLFKICVR